MLSKWAFILIGENNTGKTSFQRYLIEALCHESYERLPRNIVKDITHPRAPRKFKTIFTANRSYQEKSVEYQSVSNYFLSFFKDADICILSSHSHGDSKTHVEEMLNELTSRAYNVAGIFWSNEFGIEAKSISSLPWQERVWIDNPQQESEENISLQIRQRAYEFAELLIARANIL